MNASAADTMSSASFDNLCLFLCQHGSSLKGMGTWVEMKKHVLRLLEGWGAGLVGLYILVITVS